jgi:hypothetical protein
MTKINKDTLKANLQNGTGTIVFTKTDGSERIMKCTLKSELLPVVEIKEGAKVKVENPEVLSVWDLENEGWRSFRIDSIISADVTL